VRPDSFDGFRPSVVFVEDNRMSVEETIKKTVLKIVRKDGFDLKPTTTFKDLEADSLDMVQILVALEDYFDIEIPDDDLKGIANIGDMIAYVEGRVASKG